MRNYDLLAVDLDGTLINHEGSVHPKDIAAIKRAGQEGLHIAIATGRALVECVPIIELLSMNDPLIVSGGAMVADPISHETLERFTLESGFVHEVVDFFHGFEDAALLLKDPHVCGYDYLAVGIDGPDQLDDASKWWFEHMKVRTKFVRTLEDDPHPNETVRVGIYAADRSVEHVAGKARTKFGGQSQLQHFTGVVLPKERTKADGSPVTSVHILELFHAQADKFTALSRLANRMNVPMSRVAAIGDQSNDVQMIKGAAMGIAMGNAIDAVREVANRQTRSVADAGLSHAIEQILDGAW